MVDDGGGHCFGLGGVESALAEECGQAAQLGQGALIGGDQAAELVAHVDGRQAVGHGLGEAVPGSVGAVQGAAARLEQAGVALGPCLDLGGR